MGIHRDAASVIAHRHQAVFRQLEFYPAGMSRDGLVHRIVEDFRRQMMQRAFISAADIHAGAFAYRLEPFENLDILRRILFLLRRFVFKKISHNSLYTRSVFRSEDTLFNHGATA